MIGVGVGYIISKESLKVVLPTIPSKTVDNSVVNLMTIKNKFWDEPMVLVGFGYPCVDSVGCICLGLERFERHASKELTSALAGMVRIVEDEIEESLELTSWAGEFIDWCTVDEQRAKQECK